MELVILYFSLPLILMVLPWLVRRALETPQERSARLAEVEFDRSAMQEAAKRFDTFIEETERTVPYADRHPQAALYRHAWRRAKVFANACLKDAEQDRKRVFTAIASIAEERYKRVAPSDAYGTVKLSLSSIQAENIGDQERKLRIRDEKALDPHAAKRPLACIYIGIDRDSASPYVGQTLNEPELRWRQHRSEGTGPFKDGAEYAEWRILKGGVGPMELDRLEAYFIGLYDSYRSGHNANSGNDSTAYEKGQAERRSKESLNRKLDSDAC